MELAYIILARSADLNGDASISALGIDFERVFSPSFPAHIPLTVVAKIESDDFGEETPPSVINLDVIGPDGKSILELPIQNVELVNQKFPNSPAKQPKKKTIRAIVAMGGVPLKAAGEHEVRFEITVKAVAGTATFRKTLFFLVETV